MQDDSWHNYTVCGEASPSEVDPVLSGVRSREPDGRRLGAATTGLPRRVRLSLLWDDHHETTAPGPRAPRSRLEFVASGTRGHGPSLANLARGSGTGRHLGPDTPEQPMRSSPTGLLQTSTVPGRSTPPIRNRHPFDQFCSEIPCGFVKGRNRPYSRIHTSTPGARTEYSHTTAEL